jgi:diacylglycerol kinase (ATP)
MILAIVNPTSADGQTGKRWPQIHAALEAELGPVQAQFTKERYHAAAIAEHAVYQGATTIIVVGGDGTLNEVVNGLCASRATGQPVPLAIILQGTGGDFAKSWAVRPSVAELAQAIRENRTHPCDVVAMRLNPLADAPRVRYFINIADIGVGGQVVEIVNASSKWLGGTLTFFLASLRASLFQYRNAPMRITLDGQTIHADAAYYFVAAANAQYFGGGMHIAPAARCDDGLLDVVLVGNLSLPAKFYFAWKLYRGRAADLRAVRTLRGRRLSITSPRPVLIEADGELVGATDAFFEIMPAALSIVGWQPRS